MRLVTVLAAALIAVGLPNSAQASGCAQAGHPGGDWPSYGHDLRNTRSQPDETSIGAGEAAGLTPTWVVPVTSGQVNSTPIVAGGCMFIGGSDGVVVALNADTGDLVWRRDLDIGTPGGNGGAIVGSPSYYDGTVILLVNELQTPYAVALDASTGETIWKTIVAEDDVDDYANASTVVYDGLVFFAISGPDAGNDYSPHAHQKYYVLDAGTGDVVAENFIIPERDFEAGHRGGSIWATAAVDEATGYAYVGTGNPVSKKREHRNDNAILKIDLDRDRATFGQIVDAYKGQTDNYVPLYEQPACREFGDEPALWYNGGYAIACAQLDIDFGSSPNIWIDPEGYPIVGAYQKSGVFHAIFTETMQADWTAVLSAPGAIGNSGSSATDGESVFVGANPGTMTALDVETGIHRWVSPVGDTVSYHAVTVANGVVYSTDTKGFLNAYDASTGVPLLQRALSLDGARGSGLSSSGVSVARNTVYVGAGDSVIAYRLP